jgi:hypothetical protein
MSTPPVIPLFEQLDAHEKHRLLLACRVTLAIFDDSVDVPGVSETADQFLVSRPTAYAWAHHLLQNWPAIANGRQPGRPIGSKSKRGAA